MGYVLFSAAKQQKSIGIGMGMGYIHTNAYGAQLV
jgi:hypothetical protein